MTRPLYNLEMDEMPETANVGLWYDKFFDQWSGDFKEIEEKGKTQWIDNITKHQKKDIGEPSHLLDFTNRQRTLIEENGGMVITIQNRSPFVTGLGLNHPVENGFKWHHTLGVPYLPGSSIKGMIREWGENWDKSQDIEKLFGDEKKVGTVVILDAIPIEPVELKSDVMTLHYGPYYGGDEPPADWHDPNPIPFMVVKENQRFQIGIFPRKQNDHEDCEKLYSMLKEAFEYLGVGAKTAVGYGRFELEMAKSPEKEWIINTAREIEEEHNLLDKKIEKFAKKFDVEPEVMAVVNGAPMMLAERWKELEESELKENVRHEIVKILKKTGLWKKKRTALKNARSIYEDR